MRTSDQVEVSLGCKIFVLTIIQSRLYSPSLIPFLPTRVLHVQSCWIQRGERMRNIAKITPTREWLWSMVTNETFYNHSELLQLNIFEIWMISLLILIFISCGRAFIRQLYIFSNSAKTYCPDVKAHDYRLKDFFYKVIFSYNIFICNLFRHFWQHICCKWSWFQRGFFILTRVQNLNRLIYYTDY